MKLRDKGYAHPERQLTDKVGVRVVTFYGPEVDKVASALKRHFKIHKTKSVDKRSTLGPAEFGYRAVHLIAKLHGPRARDPDLASLRGVWFEIQIRSILEHAWALIDHEVVYKSRIRFPKPSLRRFAAIAGALEILDREFDELRAERIKLIDQYKASYRAGDALDETLDPARLLALMEVLFPSGLSWRSAEDLGTPFPRGMEATCVAALHAAGTSTGSQLIASTKGSKFRASLQRFAANKGIATQQVSHLAAILLLIGTRRPSVLKDFLPDLAADPALASAI